MPIDRLPEKWKPWGYRLRDWMISAAPMYLGCSLISFAYAYAYFDFFQGVTPRIHPLPQWTAHDFWASLWAIVSVALLVSTFWERYRIANAALSLWAALMMLWGMQYISTWALGEWERGPAVGIVHIVGPLVVTWAVWRGSRAEFVIKDEKGP